MISNTIPYSIIALFPILSLHYSLFYHCTIPYSISALFPILSLHYSLYSIIALFPILSVHYSLIYHCTISYSISALFPILSLNYSLFYHCTIPYILSLLEGWQSLHAFGAGSRQGENKSDARSSSRVRVHPHQQHYKEVASEPYA